MRKINKLIITFILILVMCPFGVFADETASESESTQPTTSFNCGNDGQPKATADECFQDSGLVSSFKDVEYIDCAVPYGITIAQLGGTYKEKVSNVHEWYKPDPNQGSLGGVYTFNPSTSTKAVGDAGNRENDYSASILSNCMNKLKTLYPSLTVQREDVSGANYVEVNGIRYYMAAVGPYFYNVAAQNNEEQKDWLKTTHGSIFDVILTDGTVFHFIMADCMGEFHAAKNAPTTYFTCVDSSRSNCSTVCRQAANAKTYERTPLIRDFYTGIIYGASPSQLLEMWFGSKDQGYSQATSSNQPIMQYMSDNNAHIAYIRRYNLTVADLDKIQLNTGVPKGASWHMIYGANSTEAQQLNAMGNAKALRVGYEEQELSSWVRLGESNINEVLDNATLDNLNGDELTAIYNWKTIATDSNAPVYLKVVRIVVQILGVLMLVWGILLYLGYHFDRTNNLVDIQIVSILTLGKLQSGKDEDSTYGKDIGMEKNGKVKVVSHRNILLICFVVILFAVLILTGALYNLLTFLIYTILDLF